MSGQRRLGLLLIATLTVVSLAVVPGVASAELGAMVFPTGGLVPSGGLPGDPRDGGTRTHVGLDISEVCGRVVRAAADGEVRELSYSSARGYVLVLQHEAGYRTLYQHLQPEAGHVESDTPHVYGSWRDYDLVVGSSVQRGQEIAKVGQTGIGGCHLHFEIHTKEEGKWTPNMVWADEAEVDVGDKITALDPIPWDFPALGAAYFGPSEQLRRRDLAAYFYRLEGAPPVSSGAAAFADSDGLAEYRAIQWMAETGISRGYGDEFRPDVVVSRAYFAEFLYRLDGLDGQRLSVDPSIPIPSDVSGAPFETAIRWMIGSGVSRVGSAFNPSAPVTRSAAASFLYRYAGEPEFELPDAEVFSDESSFGGAYEAIMWSHEFGVTSDPLSDVDFDDGFYREILWLYRTGVTEGYGDGTFRASTDVDRRTMAAFLYRYAGEPPFAPMSSPFPDVDLDDGFATEILWLADTGITVGYGDGTFRPKAVVTRGQMAAFLYRFADPAGYVPPNTQRFRDVNTEHGFFTEISWLADTGITVGYGDGTFRPSDPVNRVEMAAFLYRLHTNGVVPLGG